MVFRTEVQNNNESSSEYTNIQLYKLYAQKKRADDNLREEANARYITLHENWSMQWDGRSAEISEHTFDLADYNNISGDDRIHCIILRLKPDMIGFLEESLDCRT